MCIISIKMSLLCNGSRRLQSAATLFFPNPESQSLIDKCHNIVDTMKCQEIEDSF